MGRFQYNKQPFDMNEYFSGERVTVGGMKIDWEDKKESSSKPEPEGKSIQVAKFKETKEASTKSSEK